MGHNPNDQIGTSFSERADPVRICLRTWYVLVMGARANALTPKDAPRYHTHQKAWRVLIVGNGPTHGWGVASHKQSLVGQLAVSMRRLRGGQPVDVDYIGDEMMNAQTTATWLKNAPLNQYDQIIVAVGWNDAVRATPERIWRRSMTDLMENIHNRRSRTARVVMIGIEPITASLGYGNIIGTIAQHKANVFNDFLQELAASNEDSYLALAARPQGKAHRGGSPEVYKQWANEIATHAAPLLPGREPGKRIYANSPEYSWVGTRHALGEDGSDTPARLEEIAKQAKDYFKVHLAQINIFEGDMQLFPNHTGPTPAAVPRELTYCDTTAKQDDILIVPNGKKDDRFKDSPFLDQIHMPFYAGKSLVSRSGDVVATFCIMDVLPRPAFALNKEKFNEFADSAQQAVWAIEDEALAEKQQLVTTMP